MPGQVCLPFPVRLSGLPAVRLPFARRLFLPLPWPGHLPCSACSGFGCRPCLSWQVRSRFAGPWHSHRNRAPSVPGQVCLPFPGRLFRRRLWLGRPAFRLLSCCALQLRHCRSSGLRGLSLVSAGPCRSLRLRVPFVPGQVCLPFPVRLSGLPAVQLPSERRLFLPLP